jgi:hypothetical protein
LTFHYLNKEFTVNLKTINLRTITLLAVLLTGVLSACDRDKSTSLKSPTFSLTLDPTSLSLEQGVSKTVVVSVVAKDGFEDAVAITIESEVLTASALQIAKGASSGTLTVTAKADAPAGSGTARIKGSSGSLNAESSLQVTITQPAITKTSVSGQVENYTSGAASLQAILGITEAPVVGEGSLSETGALSLELNPIATDVLLDDSAAMGWLGFGVCAEVVATPSSYKSAGLALIEAAKDEDPQFRAVVLQISSTEFLEDLSQRIAADPVVPGEYVLWVYVDTSVNLSGECDATDVYNLPTRIDLSLKPGWNAYSVAVTATDMSITSEVLDVPWLVYLVR